MNPRDSIRKFVREIQCLQLPHNWFVGMFYWCFYWFAYLSARLWEVLYKIFWVEPVVRTLAASVGKRLRIERVPWITGLGRLTIGHDVYISGKISIAYNSRLGLDPHLSIGDRSFVGHDCAFTIAHYIRIGADCRIAGGVLMYDNIGHPIDPVARRNNQPIDEDQVKPILIGDNVWVGVRAIILPGVTIGDNSIIGAGAIVTKDVPANTIVGGNPAKPIRVFVYE